MTNGTNTFIRDSCNSFATELRHISQNHIHKKEKKQIKLLIIIN